MFTTQTNTKPFFVMGAGLATMDPQQGSMVRPELI